MVDEQTGQVLDIVVPTVPEILRNIANVFENQSQTIEDLETQLIEAESQREELLDEQTKRSGGQYEQNMADIADILDIDRFDWYGNEVIQLVRDYVRVYREVDNMLKALPVKWQTLHEAVKDVETTRNMINSR